MDDQQFSSYLEQAQQFVAQLDSQQGAREELLQLIDLCQEGVEADSPYQAFFKGEKALFSGECEQALRFYLQAKGIKPFEFFCYRASAMISQEHGHLEKAQYFAKKALKLMPDDYICKQISDSVEFPTITNVAAPYPVQSIDENLAFLTLSNAAHSCAAMKGSDDSAEEAITQENLLGNDNLEREIHSFHQRQPALMRSYLESAERRHLSKDHCLYILGGTSRGIWPSPACNSLELSQIFSAIQPHRGKEGLFLRWNGKGVAINPGSNFLSSLHRQELHIRDIDAIVVTKESSETFASIKEIYDLNYKLNQVAAELHIIHYYFNEKAYQLYAPQLKPNFKQERSALHCLELFVDSPDVETIDLGEGILLHYFPTGFQEAYKERRVSEPSSLGINLELSTRQEGLAQRSVRLGYIGATSWSPLLAHLLGPCDVLVAAFGSTGPSDYEKVSYNDDSLGYFGIYSLMEEVRPRIVLCSEFDGLEGDIRVEVAQRLRSEGKAAGASTVVLPADNSLFLNLLSNEIACSVSQQPVAAQHVMVVKSSYSFGPLQYLSPACCL